MLSFASMPVSATGGSMRAPVSIVTCGSQEVMDACDRTGMMMMCETRQMSSSPEGMAQLETMIKRYRNSPSIIIWSMGNEEWTMMPQPQGVRVIDDMIARTHE